MKIFKRSSWETKNWGSRIIWPNGERGIFLATTIERTSCCGNGKTGFFSTTSFVYCSTEEVLSFHNQPWRRPTCSLSRSGSRARERQFSASKSHTIEPTRFAGNRRPIFNNRNTDPAAQETPRRSTNMVVYRTEFREVVVKEEVAEWKERRASSLSSTPLLRDNYPSSVFQWSHFDEWWIQHTDTRGQKK